MSGRCSTLLKEKDGSDPSMSKDPSTNVRSVTKFCDRLKGWIEAAIFNKEAVNVPEVKAHLFELLISQGGFERHAPVVRLTGPLARRHGRDRKSVV